ncbi:MAG TPA: DUF3858 domain-containing protein [Pedobacter sp.]|nr:DUF3858 domain-containing protein [Pedobacter sp.]
MNKLIFLLVTLIFGVSQTIIAQNTTTPPKQIPEKVVKYGKISPEEFETKVTGSDSAASAVVLFDIGNAIFELSGQKLSFVYVLERHIRYKIISKTGYDYANLEIPLYNDGDDESYLADMDGATYTMENGKMVTTKISKSSKFTERQDKNFTIKKFALPNVKEGSIIEFKYTIKSDFVGRLNWYFQNNIPTLYSEYDVTIPQFFKYKIDQAGLIDIKPTRELGEQNMVSFYGGGTMETARTQFRVENVPALKVEKFVPTMQEYISKVEFELTSMRMPGQSFMDYSLTWPKIVTQLKDYNRFGGFLAPNDFVKKTLAKIITPDTKPDTVPFLIFDYVKNNIKWNDQMGIYGSSTSAEKVFEKKTGNSADINLTMLALFKEAKIEAAPIILSTRTNGLHPKYPILSKFNNVIIDVKIGERHIFFDATSKNHTPDIIAFQNLNHEGFKVDFATNKGEWVNTDEYKISRRSINSYLTLDKENKLTGKMQLTCTDYDALDKRNKYGNAVNEEEYLKSFRSDKPGLGIKDYKAENLSNPNEPFVESMDVMLEDNVEEAGDLIYFTPMLFEKTKENPFVIDDRKYPVDFGHPNEEVYRMTIEIPKDYTFDKLPKSEKISLLEDAASFSFIIGQEENKISLVSKISFKKSVYTVQEYHDLKELFSNIVRKQAEQIVIKKS